MNHHEAEINKKGIKLSSQVYLEQHKKKAKDKGKKCHAKTMRSKKKPIELIHKVPLMCRLGRRPRRKNEGRS